jgi:hypothetical protein
MPTKILTDQPQTKRFTLQRLATTSFTTLVEAPYFSVPLTDEDVAVEDPDDVDRELRAGEIFIASAIQVTNKTSTGRTIEIVLEGEGGTDTVLAPAMMVPGNDVLYLPPGISLFKRDLDDPTATADRLRVRASANSALEITVSVVEREAIDHAPDTEGT